ncbi:hypothetical protein MTO96_013159 [Rhipicephalus appendiculatus]
MFVIDDDDDSLVNSSPFDRAGIMDILAIIYGAPGEGTFYLCSVDDSAGKIQPSSSVVSTEDHQHRPVSFSTSFATRNAAAAKVATVVTGISSNPGMACPSTNREVQRSQHLRSSLPLPTNAFMLFAQEKRRWVAAEQLNGNNERLSTTLEKLCRFFNAVETEPYQRKAAEAAAANLMRYLDAVLNHRATRQRKEQERSRCSRMTASGESSSSSSGLPRPLPGEEADQISSICPLHSSPQPQYKCHAPADLDL